jgi:hypothetical protein
VTWCGSRPVRLAWGDADDGDVHIAIQEKLSGAVVDWMEHVSNEQYRRATSRPGDSGVPILPGYHANRELGCSGSR